MYIQKCTQNNNYLGSQTPAIYMFYLKKPHNLNSASVVTFLELKV